MRLLLDTHVWLWLLAASDRLRPAVLQQLAEADDLVLSAACVWEVVVKHGLGKLPLPVPPDRLVTLSCGEAGMRALPLTAEHLLGVAELPLLHRDPFDRALVAQARAEGLTLVTADPRVQDYPVPVLPV
jgi:PIN domain nuclease of toxin-antitoxin system